MYRTFAMSDIHGQYEPMIKLLEKTNFNPINDKLMIIGDMIDRGPSSGKVVKYLKKLQEKHPEHIKVSIGNHEIMMRQYVFEGKNHMWLRYGGQECIKDFNDTFHSERERDEHLVWLANLPLYIEENEYFFTHAGIDVAYELDEQYEDVTFIEIPELYSIDEEDLHAIIGKRKLVHGHTPYHSVYDTGKYISCDLGASVFDDGKLALINLTSKIYYEYNMKTNNIKIKEISKLDKNKRIYELK